MDTIWEPELADGPGPKYRAVADGIRRGIAGGDLAAGSKLPPVRDLAWKLGITPGTVARAYTLLTDEGLLNAEVGRGTFVAEPADTTEDPPYVPIEVDTIPHGSPREMYRVNFFSPAMKSLGQAELIRSLLHEVADDPPSGVMHYPSRDGARPAREAILHWLADCPLGPADEQDVVLSAGGQHGILMTMQALLSGRRPTVLVEQLAYPGFRRAADLLRADVVEVAMDENGLIPEALEAVLARCDAQLLCTSPEVHNPTTGTTPPARRREIAAIAAAHGLHVLEDDCYRMTGGRGPTYRELLPELGWYVASVAKTISPALRIGAVIAPKKRSASLRRALEHGMFGLPTPLTDLAAKLLTDPRLPPLVDEVVSVFADYGARAAAILDGHDVAWRRDVPFLWITLPEGWRAGPFCQAAEAADAPVRPAEEFAGRDSRAPHAVRLALNAQARVEDFEAAIRRLRDLLDNPREQIGV